MRIYKTTHCITQWDMDDADFLLFLKKTNPNDEDIQQATSLKEIIKEYGCINEFAGELDTYLTAERHEMEIVEGVNNYFEDYSDAYYNMVYGHH